MWRHFTTAREKPQKKLRAAHHCSVAYGASVLDALQRCFAARVLLKEFATAPSGLNLHPVFVKRVQNQKRVREIAACLLQQSDDVHLIAPPLMLAFQVVEQFAQRKRVGCPFQGAPQLERERDRRLHFDAFLLLHRMHGVDILLTDAVEAAKPFAPVQPPRAMTVPDVIHPPLARWPPDDLHPWRKVARQRDDADAEKQTGHRGRESVKREFDVVAVGNFGTELLL